MTDNAQQLATAITVVVTGVLTVMAQIYREGRQRRWDVEDRERLAADLAAKVETAHATIATALDEEKTASHEFRRQTTSAIQGVHDAADSAYKEANHVNVKISDLNERLLQQEKDRSADLGPEILKTGQETKVIAEDIQKAVK